MQELLQEYGETIVTLASAAVVLAGIQYFKDVLVELCSLFLRTIGG